jgi:UDP-GlcNAc:undecaprenyl-phosphate/decaprenyl-phosphate GlcNAc-1-phosphate transferase
VNGLLGGFLVSAAVTAVSMSVLLPLLRHAQIVDVPVERSLHERPVARGAGLALIPGVLAGLTAAVVLSGDPAAALLSPVFQLLLAVAASLTFATIGLTDDLYGVSALTRLGMQVLGGILVGTGVTVAAERSWVWVPLLTVAIVAMVNMTNFMDGANGLLGLHGLVTAAWFAVVAVQSGPEPLAVFALTVGGALVCFLPFNVPVARAFLGDVGSYGLGAAWATLATWVLLGGGRIETAAAPLLVFGADTAYTLQLRLRAGQRWYQPHKLHVYQRLVAAGWPHLATSALVAGTALMCCLLAVPSFLGADTPVRLLCLAGMAVACAVYLRMPVWVGAPEPWHQARAGLLR